MKILYLIPLFITSCMTSISQTTTEDTKVEHDGAVTQTRKTVTTSFGTQWDKSIIPFDIPVVKVRGK